MVGYYTPAWKSRDRLPNRPSRSVGEFLISLPSAFAPWRQDIKLAANVKLLLLQGTKEAARA